MAIQDGGLGIDFTPEKAGGFVGNRGTPIVHEIGVKCPCLQMDGEGGLEGQADPNCSLCGGSSYLYRNPTNTVGIISNMSANRFWSMVSWVQPGDLLLSPHPDYRRLGDFDKIIVRMPTPVDDMVIKRGIATSLTPRPEGLKANEDVLFWEAVRFEALWVEDQKGVAYKPGDYLLRGRKIEWIANQPPVGTKYTVKYEGYPEYVVWTTPVERFDRSRLIGQRVMLRRAVLSAPENLKKLQSELSAILSDENAFNSEDVYDHFGKVFDAKVNPRR